MDGYMIVAEDTEDGVWWAEPNAFPTEREALDWARTQRKPPKGYAWVIYTITFKREATELSI